MSWLFPSGGQSIGDSASASVLPMNIRSWLPVGLTGLISLESKSLLQHHNSKASVLHRSAFFRASLIAQLVKNPLAMQETPVRFLGWEDPLEKGKATHSSNSGLENSMDCMVHGVAKSQTRLSNFHFLAFFMVQLSHPYMTTRKTIALAIWPLVSKVMSLLFNMF